ncbi:MAG TPA: hypothetical protein VG325_02740 [Solirubrobacteraceae bacterium]|nr:hypothetical protein [Solirubrobacteraceae bacterium]
MMHAHAYRSRLSWRGSTDDGYEKYDRRCASRASRHVEMLLRRALDDLGRMPQQAQPVSRRGRPHP